MVWLWLGCRGLGGKCAENRGGWWGVLIFGQGPFLGSMREGEFFVFGDHCVW